MAKGGLLFKILGIVVSITIIGLAILIYKVISQEEKNLLDEKKKTSQLMAQPILHTIYKDMLDERADMARYLAEAMKATKGTERVQIIRSNGVEEAFQDFKTLKAVEKEYGDLKPEWTTNHPNKANNIARGIDNPKFKEALKLFNEGKKEGISYIEQDEGKRLLTYLEPIEMKPKCSACHVTKEDARGVLMISTSLDDMYAALASSRMQWITYGFFTIAGVISLLTLLVRNIITKPIEETVIMLKGIAEGKGDLTKRLTVTSKDEVGMLGIWFNKFVIEMRNMVKGIFATSKEVSSASNSIKHFTENIHNSAETQLQAVNDTSTSIAEMDASIQSVTSDAEKLLHATDSASASSLEMSASISEVAQHTEKLATSVDVTSSAISEIAASLNQVSLHVNDLLMETEQVVSTTNQVNGNIKEIGVLSKEEAKLAEKVVDIVAERLDAIHKSSKEIGGMIENVAKTSSVMNRLGERSKEIGSIIGVINEIADTTNLLALNASILAAQAGEHGKGFAVVADEIKNLAKRTATSTKEIAYLIEQVKEDVTSAVNSVEYSSSGLIKETVTFSKGVSTALTGIADSSKASLNMARKIERATDEQAEGVEQVTMAIQKINSMVEGIKKATDEQSRASTEISQTTEEMNDITQRVKQSLAEQSKTGKYIAQVISDVAQKMQTIAKAMNEQKTASERIMNAIETIRAKSEEELSLTTGLDKTVDNLALQSTLLNEKVGSFKV